MPAIDGAKIRIKLQKHDGLPESTLAAEIYKLIENSDKAEVSQPLTLYKTETLQDTEKNNFAVLVDSRHSKYEEAALLVMKLAVPKTRGTQIEEYTFSTEKIAWLGGNQKTTRFLLQDFFSMCNQSSVRREALCHICNILSEFRFARMVLQRGKQIAQITEREMRDGRNVSTLSVEDEETRISAKKKCDYALESDCLETWRAIHTNSELAASHCFVASPLHGSSPEWYCLPITSSKGSLVKEVCMQKLNIRLRCEYTFQSDTVTRSIPNFHLRSPKSLRKYQNEAIAAAFVEDRACSGLVVLPCGAGKTLTGISIASKISKRLLILCVNTFSVYQWRDQIVRWTRVSPKSISVITSSVREEPAEIVITTYTMLTMDDERRNDRSRELISAMLLEPFGLVLLDEVHMAAAKNFRRVVEVVHGHCFIGLTATLLREDEKIADLDYLIGPLLYECSMYALKKAGSIADVRCTEVLCPFPQGYLLQHLLATSDLHRRKLYNMNPTKIWCCQALIQYHETRCPPDKTLVFVDSIAMLEFCARLFKRPMIHGETGDFERDCILSWFKNSDEVNTMFISRIGDSALDIPETNVIIQLSSLFGSQRTEVQRIGRIQRLKASNKRAYFYSLVTPDTREVSFSTRRKQFLLSEGYGYNILPHTDITDYIFFKSESCSELPAVAPFCIGMPHWGFQGAPSDTPIALSVKESVHVEKSVLFGRDHVRVHDTPHMLPQPNANKLPPLDGNLRIGPFVRSSPHEAFCETVCLQSFLKYVQSEGKDFLSSQYNLPDGDPSLEQKRVKTIERAVKASTQSTAFKRRDREIHKFRKHLQERNVIMRREE